MSTFITRIATLSATEDFFEFLGVPYDPVMVRVKRLHILKSFNERIAKLDLSGLDDEALRDALLITLEAAGHAAVGAGGGPQALELIARQPFNMVVTDLRMATGEAPR